MANTGTTIDPESGNYFRTQRRRITDTYNMGSAQNLYQQATAGNTLQRSIGDIAYNYNQMRQKMPWSFAARGLMNSGVWQKAVSDAATGGYIRPVANATAAYQDQLQGLQLALQQLGQTTTSSLSDIDQAEQARIAAVAASLRGAAI